ncbi:monothiol glutaredoxin-S11 [Galendromus occidentalis]|uniref:Monothiol glutaredoxin-S11 n=1 Tax=Galendromus occidentalis TaxID=34638 RepID=A0AAJ7L2J9_9ACAR|nr:monothiol glutaredoxin-S11 [Galendromus occidentalis]
MEVIKSKEDFEKASTNSLKGFLVVHFFAASWSPECTQMEDVIKEIAADHPKTKFFRIEAEELEAISQQYGITAVPEFVFLLGKATQEKMRGADPSSFMHKVRELEKKAETACLGDEATKSASSSAESLDTRLRKLIDSKKVMIFMKGDPNQPRCGFSRKAIEMLKKHSVEFGYFDILTDNDVREGLKKYSNWPSYPQLYVKGDLVGGVDIMAQLEEEGSLKGVLEGSA